MKTEGLTAEEATEIVLNDGEVEDKDGGRWNSGHLRLPFAENNAPFRVITPPPDAEPVVTAEELLDSLLGLGSYTSGFLRERLAHLKAARAPKPEPQPIRTLAEALACERLRLVDADRYEEIHRRSSNGWYIGDRVNIQWALDGYDKGRRVYDASKEEQAK